MKLVRVALCFVYMTIVGCASIPGKTDQEQVQFIDELVKRTLNDLYAQKPFTREEISQSFGYAILKQKNTKIPFLGAGRGYGVAIRNKTGEKTYVKITRFDIGSGFGTRSVRVVLITQDEQRFNRFVKGNWTTRFGAEATVKAGESGAAGGLDRDDIPSDKRYSAYVITDTGVSATATVGVIRVKPMQLKR